MTINEVAKLKVGSIIIDCLGTEKEVVSIKDCLYELKWRNENGELSVGSEYQVPCHFEYDRLLRL